MPGPTWQGYIRRGKPLRCRQRRPETSGGDRAGPAGRPRKASCRSGRRRAASCSQSPEVLAGPIKQAPCSLRAALTKRVHVHHAGVLTPAAARMRGAALLLLLAAAACAPLQAAVAAAVTPSAALQPISPEDIYFTVENGDRGAVVAPQISVDSPPLNTAGGGATADSVEQCSSRCRAEPGCDWWEWCGREVSVGRGQGQGSGTPRPSHMPAERVPGKPRRRLPPPAAIRLPLLPSIDTRPAVPTAPTRRSLTKPAACGESRACCRRWRAGRRKARRPPRVRARRHLFRARCEIHRRARLAP